MEAHLKSLLETQTQRLMTSRKEKVEIESLLIESYKREKALLENLTTLQKSYDSLLRKNEIVEGKYRTLSTSKPGRFTLAYWRWRKSRQNRRKKRR